MGHRLLPPVCMATVMLCLQWAAGGHANSTRPGGRAPAVCLGLPLTEGTMAAITALDRASWTLSPQHHRAKAPPALRGGHKITTNTLGFGDMAPGNREVKGAPVVAFIMEVNARLRRKTCQAEQGAVIILLDERCFWNGIAWSFSYHACRYLAHNADLLYHGLLLPLYRVASILVTMTTATQLLTRCMRSYQSWRESKQQSSQEWPGSAPSTGWGAASYTDCAICLQAYEPGGALKLLSCSHAYHGQCIDLWHRVQTGSKTCPLCLRSITTVALIHLGVHSNEQD